MNSVLKLRQNDGYGPAGLGGPTLSSRLLCLFVLVAFWCATATVYRSFPSPWAVMCAMGELFLDDSFGLSILASCTRVVEGFLLAVVLALFLGALSIRSKVVATLVDALELLRSVPPLAWLPLVLALLGMNEQSVVLLIFLGALFPMLTASRRAFDASFREGDFISRVLNLRDWTYLRYILIPGALPELFTGLQVSLGVAWVCLVAAEFLASALGLGVTLQLYRQVLRLDMVLACIVSIASLGALMQLLLKRAECWASPWRIASEAVGESLSGGEASQPAYAVTPRLSQSGAELRSQRVSFSYQNPILREISLRISSGERIAVVGASGSGKTTLLKILSGLLVPSSGNVEGIPSPDRLGLVTPEAKLLPWLSVLENVSLGGSDCSRRRCESVLTKLGIWTLRLRYPRALSAGQYQRVCLARALLRSPTLLVLDEPSASLDVETRANFHEDLLSVLKHSRATLLIATHDLDEALLLADRIFVVRSGSLEYEHRVRRDATDPETFLESRTFTEQKRILTFQIRGQNYEANSSTSFTLFGGL